MKLICDCGNEVVFEEIGELDQFGESDLCRFKNATITSNGDDVWITCSNCDKSICIGAD